ncbi:MAG: hypothetical protein ACYS26_18545, partial [Planctomycetota bacterium]
MKSLLPWTSALAGLALAAGLDRPLDSSAPGQPAAHPFARTLPDLDEKIDEDDVETLLEEFCNPYLEGRDTPSLGLEYTAERIAAHLASFGCSAPEPSDTVEGFFHSYTLERPQPDAGRCAFEALNLDADEAALAAVGLDDGWTLDLDFTPMLRAEGRAEGLLQFCGYGIDVKGYRGLKDFEVEGRIAVFVE